jgi:hypothetical protein
MPLVHGDSIGSHLDRARSRAQAGAIVRRITAACWPGSGADRTEPAARMWLARWRPERAAAQLPACTCAKGPCTICN